MKILEIKQTVFPEVKVIRFGRFPDERGFFTEAYRKSDLIKNIGLDVNFEVLQVNISYSKTNVVRGLHFQWKPDMSKLIRVVDGGLVDLFMDIRKNSPNFGKIAGVKLESSPDKSEENMIWIPAGFAHGVAFTKNSYLEYFCNAEYSPTTEAGIYPQASDIDWNLCDPNIKKDFDAIAQYGVISEKDKAGLTVTSWKNDARSENFIY